MMKWQIFLVLMMSVLVVRAQAPRSLTIADPRVKEYFEAADKAGSDWEKAHPKIAERVRGVLGHVHDSFYKYLLAHDGVWPQQPESLPDEASILKWYSKLLAPYGLPEHDLEGFFMVVFTNYEPTPLKAYAYSTQPWAIIEIERSGGPGRLSTIPSYHVFADGSILADGVRMIPYPFKAGMAIDRGAGSAKVPEELQKAVNAVKKQ